MHILVAPMLISEIRGKKETYLYMEVFAPPNHGLAEGSKKHQEERVSYSQPVSQYLLSQFLFSILSSKRPRSSPGVFTGYKIFMQT